MKWWNESGQIVKRVAMGFVQGVGTDEACVECVVHFARVMFPHARDFFFSFCFLTFQNFQLHAFFLLMLLILFFNKVALMLKS